MIPLNTYLMPFRKLSNSLSNFLHPLFSNFYPNSNSKGSLKLARAIEANLTIWLASGSPFNFSFRESSPRKPETTMDEVYSIISSKRSTFILFPVSPSYPLLADTPADVSPFFSNWSMTRSAICAIIGICAVTKL